MQARLAERTRGLSDELFVLVLDAFTEGQRQGARRVRDELRAFLKRRQHELEARYESLTPEDVEAMKEALGDGEGRGAAVVAARFGGAANLLAEIGYELDRVAREPGSSKPD